MYLEVQQIRFHQKAYPNLGFDILPLESIPERTNLNHSPLKLHQIDFYLMLIVTEGKGRHTIDFTDYELHPGSVLTVRKDQIHKFMASQAKGHILLFTDTFLISYLEKLEASKTLQLFNELLGHPCLRLAETAFEGVQKVIREIQQEFLHERDDYSPSIIRSYLHILISKLYRVKFSGNSLIVGKKYLGAFIKFQTLVEIHGFKTKRVTDYAHWMGVSSKTLNNIAQEIAHVSAKVFIDQIVITQIKRLLINSALSVKEIAYEAGFEEPTNLYKYFKRYTQQTPEAFRQSNF